VSSRVLTVAVDFDGVLHSYDKGWHDGTIYGDWTPGAEAALRQLMRRYAVFIHSTRRPEQVAKWLLDRGFSCRIGYDGEFWNEQGVLLVTDRKLPAVAYIDDRAVRFINWPDALTAVGIEPLATGERRETP
jgi:hypothetical protein